MWETSQPGRPLTHEDGVPNDGPRLGARARPGGGTGVGLTIARHLVEAHSGRIVAESPGLGQGSTFTVFLPLCPLPVTCIPAVH